MKLLHGFDIFLRRSRGLFVRIVQLGSVEIPNLLVQFLSIEEDILGRLVLCPIPASLHHCPDQPSVHLLSDHRFHHRQMLEIIVRLEEGVAGEELHQDTPNTPDVTRKAPAEIEDDFRGSIMAGGHNGRVILLVKRGRAKVDKPDFTVPENSSLTSTPRAGVRRGRNCSIVGEGLIMIAQQEDILGFQVGVDEVEIVEDYRSARTQDQYGLRRTRNAGKQLSCKTLDMCTRERHETVPFEEIEHALPEEVGHDTDMIPVVEAVSEVDALVAILFVVRRQRRQDSEFDPGGVAVLLDRTDNLYRTHGLSLLVICLGDFAECPLAQQSHDGI